MPFSSARGVSFHLIDESLQTLFSYISYWRPEQSIALVITIILSLLTLQ